MAAEKQKSTIGSSHHSKRGVKKGTKRGNYVSRSSSLLKVIKSSSKHGGILKYQPRHRDKKYVSMMSACGIPQEKIAEILGISFVTLQKLFKKELSHALSKKNMAVAQALFDQATKEGNVTAQIFWLKSRARWRENDPLPPAPQTGIPYDPNKLEIHELAVLHKLLAKARLNQIVDVEAEE